MSETVPLSYFYFATASKHYCLRETATVARTDGFAIEGKPLTHSSQEQFPSCGIADAASHRPSVFHITDRNAPFRNSGNELPCAV
jgi:hypothetical protein